MIIHRFWFGRIFHRHGSQWYSGPSHLDKGPCTQVQGRRKMAPLISCTLRHGSITHPWSLTPLPLPPRPKAFLSRSTLVSTSGETQAVAMAERACGAAARRRERQLRAWHRHERLTVAMELATALHHSAKRPRPVVEVPREGEEVESHSVPRHRETPPPPTRPTVGRRRRGPRSGAPLLYPVVMEQEAAHDDDLLAQSLLHCQEEEAKKRREEGGGESQRRMPGRSGGGS